MYAYFVSFIVGNQSTFSRLLRQLQAFPRLPQVTHCAAVVTGWMFPALVTGRSLCCGCYWLNVLPRLPQVTHCAVVVTGWASVFPRFLLTAYFPSFAARYLFFGACYWSQAVSLSSDWPISHYTFAGVIGSVFAFQNFNSITFWQLSQSLSLGSVGQPIISRAFQRYFWLAP